MHAYLSRALYSPKAHAEPGGLLEVCETASIASKYHANCSLAARCPTLRRHPTSAVWLHWLRPVSSAMVVHRAQPEEMPNLARGGILLPRSRGVDCCNPAIPRAVAELASEAKCRSFAGLDAVRGVIYRTFSHRLLSCGGCLEGHWICANLLWRWGMAVGGRLQDGRAFCEQIKIGEGNCRRYRSECGRRYY